jgi:hypothetical protein
MQSSKLSQQERKKIAKKMISTKSQTKEVLLDQSIFDNEGSVQRPR